jgi:hypothetical protein
VLVTETADHDANATRLKLGCRRPGVDRTIPKLDFGQIPIDVSEWVQSPSKQFHDIANGPCRPGDNLAIWLQHCCIVRRSDRTQPDNDAREREIDFEVANKSYEDLML